MSKRSMTVEIKGDASGLVEAVEEARSALGRLEVTREPLTYELGAERSYFQDLTLATNGDNGANARLERHAKELTVELERRDQTAKPPQGIEYRVNPNRTQGTGGYFAPPLWLIDAFATAPRAKRVLTNQIPRFALPQGVQSVNLPRLTTGTSEQTASDDATDPGTDIVDVASSATVATISGHGDVALQLLEQSPAGAHLDFAFFKDLSEAYDAQLEVQTINGSGTGNQLTGLLQVVPAGNQVTYTNASPKATDMVPLLGQVAARVGNNRKLPPEQWLLTTSRLAWITSSEDLQNRPLGLTDRDSDGKADILVWPSEPDDAVPTTLGAGANQDIIMACRPSDSMLFESEPRAAVHLEVLSGVLMARIQLHAYAAVLHRYPTGAATLSGTGLVIQSGF